MEFERELYAITPWLAPFGIDRVVYGWGPIDIAPGLPPKQLAQTKAFWSRRKQHESSRDELAVRQSRTEPQVRRTGDLGDMPLMVISADKQLADWFELQKELATLSTDSVHRVIDGSSMHLSLAFDKPRCSSDQCVDSRGSGGRARRSTAYAIELLTQPLRRASAF